MELRSAQQLSSLSAYGLGVLQSFLEVSARAELRGLACGDLDALAGLRVHALARAPLGNRELAEAGDRDVASALQRLLDHLGQGVDGGLCLRTLDVGAVSYLLDQLGLVQVIPPCSIPWSAAEPNSANGRCQSQVSACYAGYKRKIRKLRVFGADRQSNREIGSRNG